MCFEVSDVDISDEALMRKLKYGLKNILQVSVT